MDAEKELADLEFRVKKVESVTEKELADLRREASDWHSKAGKLQAELEKTAEAWKAGLELTKALESQVRERNEQVLQLQKDAEFGSKLRELLSQVVPSASGGAGGKDLELKDVKWRVAVKDEVRQVEASDTTSCRGRLLKLAKLGFFDQRRALRDILEEFPKRGWSDSDKTVANTLASLFEAALIAKEQNEHTRKWEYFKPDGVVFA